MRRLLAGLVFSLQVLGSGAAYAHEGPALVIVVRHAEKGAEPAADPLLSPVGAQRAQALAAALKDSGVGAIVTTQLQRTRATAQPLADALGIEGDVVAAGGSDNAAHVQAVADAVRRHAGKVVLVVGHSNTVPGIVHALGGPQMPDLCDAEFDRMFVVVPAAEGAAVVKSRYGEPSKACM